MRHFRQMLMNAANDRDGWLPHLNLLARSTGTVTAPAMGAPISPARQHWRPLSSLNPCLLACCLEPSDEDVEGSLGALACIAVAGAIVE